MNYYEKIVNWYRSHNIAIIIYHIPELRYIKPNLNLNKKNLITKI